MENDEKFVDYYARLNVQPTCDTKVLEKAYRQFAHMYHPDHPETADVVKFQEIIEAYRILRDPENRARYDEIYAREKGSTYFRFPNDEDIRIDNKSAVEDAEVNEKILFLLYKRRRERSDDPGVVGYYIQKMLGCSDENYDFHVWYLKSKGFVEVTEQGTLAITIEGVDHVISMSRTIEAEKLLLAQSPKFEDQDGRP